MFNLTNYQENTNQNHNEIPPNTCQNGYYRKSQEITNAGEDMEKREPSYMLVGMSIGAATIGNSMEIPQKSKNRTTI